MSDPQDNPAKTSPSGPLPLKDGPGHSDIFDRLSAETDLVGLVAYGLYQRRKRCWLKDFQTKHKRYPTPEERDSYSFGYRDDAVEALRREAEGGMAVFAEGAIEEQLPELRRGALDSETQAVLGSIDNRLIHLGGYGHHIVGHLVGFVILVGGLAILAVLISYEPSLDGILHWITNHLPHSK
jgi:hypothetical protein